MIKESDKNKSFDEVHVIEKLKHYLPSQAPLKDFVHHNTLHAFQDYPFHTALQRASNMLGYRCYLSLKEYRALFAQGRIRAEVLDQVIADKKGKGAIDNWKEQMLSGNYEESRFPEIGRLRRNWKLRYRFNLEKTTYPLLFRIIGNYLDQGISTWEFPISSEGLLASIRAIERNSYTSFFRSERAICLLRDENVSIEELLDILVYKKDLYESYLFDLCFAHPGWSGMVSFLEDNSGGLLDPRKISLKDFIILELIMEIDALDAKMGENWIPMGLKLASGAPAPYLETVLSNLFEIYALWQEAFEWSYYDEVLAGVLESSDQSVIPAEKSFQALFCIDDRESSLRRYVESLDPNCSTFGTPGHFNISAFFQPEESAFYSKICPAPVPASHLIKEVGSNRKTRKAQHFSNHDHSPLQGLFATQTIGLWSAVKLFTNIFRPTDNVTAVSSFKHMDASADLIIERQNDNEIIDGVKVGYSVDEMTQAMKGMLENIGLLRGFAPIVYLIGHGASSVNNTYYAGYDCGACSGRPGSVNARVASYMLNHAEVRGRLNAQGFQIPKETIFIGGLHDTTVDEIQYFDTDALNATQLAVHQKNQDLFVKALDMNAKERARRFLLTKNHKSAAKTHKKVKLRAVSLFEARPEYNHATNALCLVGRRSAFKQLFLDRRAFMNSYDYREDPNGLSLRKILEAAVPVCGGINLEYYFSRMDNEMLGAGSKLSHNVLGLIGVANGADGDLRPGLPYQMVEIHDPLRLMLIIEQEAVVVMKCLQEAPHIKAWFDCNWLHLSLLEPESKKLMRYRDGQFQAYVPIQENVERLNPWSGDWTHQSENLPVYLIKND